jgi:hypothetical protein
MVDGPTAAHVAKDEREFYDYALSGVWGEADKLKAEKLGLKGIAEHVLREERRGRVDGFVVRDLITDETYWRPGACAEPNCYNDFDHVPDPDSLKLTLAAADYEVPDGSNVVLVAEITCRLCGRRAQAKPLGFRWPERS